MVARNNNKKPLSAGSLIPSEAEQKFKAPRVVHIENGQVIQASMQNKPGNKKPKQNQSNRNRRPRRDFGKKPLPSFSEHRLHPKEGVLSDSEMNQNSLLKKDTVYYVPLGGLEEIGRNCAFFEYNDEIVIIDMGIQFPEAETPGVDWIIPNISYLEKKKKKIKALIITHGHYDHFGAVPYVLEKLGNPTIYGTALIKAILEKKLAEMPNVPKMKFQIIKNHDRVKFSQNFTAEFFGVSHTIPDTTGVVLETPAGKMVHFADFRLEYDEKGNPLNMKEFEWLSKQKIHSLLMDSTNADGEGRSTSEKIVEKNLEELFKAAEGRIILSTFASMIERLGEIITIAERIGRKVLINGRSMKENIEIAKTLGYLKFNPGVIVPLEEIKNLPDNKILLLSTGAQGQENAGLMRIVTGQHRHVQIKAGDTVIFSSSVIPGNERSVQNLKDNFARQGAIVHTNQDLDIHSSGHCLAEDLLTVVKMTKPHFVIPVHAHYYKRAANIQTLKKIGFPKEKVIMLDNGYITEITKNNIRFTGKTIPAYYILVDGLGVGDVEAVVMRDRRHLSEEGMIVIVSTINKKTGQLLKNPDIISRGFIYLRDNTELINQVRDKIKNTLNQTKSQKNADSEYIKTLIREQVSDFLYRKTERRPMVLPVVIEV